MPMRHSLIFTNYQKANRYLGQMIVELIGKPPIAESQGGIQIDRTVAPP